MAEKKPRYAGLFAALILVKHPPDTTIGQEHA
jgi:hypothetical protein